MSDVILQPGDIMLEKVNGLFGWAMQLFTSDKYQHAAVVWHDTSKVIEDWENGVAVTPIHMAEKYREIWRPKCSADMKKRALDRMALRLGEPYGVESLVAEGAYLDWGIKLPHGRGMYCSELVCWAFSTEYELVPGVSPENTPPEMLRNTTRLDRIQ